MNQSNTCRFAIRAILAIFMATMTATAQVKPTYTIYAPGDPTYSEALAAKEIRRYFYLRTGAMFPIVAVKSLPARVGNAIVVGTTARPVYLSPVIAKSFDMASKSAGLDEQAFLLKTVPHAKGNMIIAAGVGEAAVLYAAYTLAEKTGVGFDLDGDVIPDAPFTSWAALDGLDEINKPLFNLRGTNPFHDFPEGPDLWDLDDYKSYLTQLSKLKMNFIGLHTYPESTPHGAEPTVWIGASENVNPDGTVKESYRASYFSNARNKVGYSAKNTGTFAYGASQLFEENIYANDVMAGLSPYPGTNDYNTLFNRTGLVFNKAFSFARQVGIKTCIGTESPLYVPVAVRDNAGGKGISAIYEGIFARIKKTHPLDYYWMWTNEEGTHGQAAVVSDLLAAHTAAKKVYPELVLSTAGWSLGVDYDPLIPKDMAMSAINGGVGKTPVDGRFANINGRMKWAIPWFEDDGNMVAPQLWAKRMYRDAQLALQYKCTGLMGLHWRTRVVGPQVSALAQLGWRQADWTAQNFYTDWARRHFGPEAAAAIGNSFVPIDGALPEPSKWGGGPGLVVGGGDYAFVTELEAHRALIRGRGNLERYDYWLNTFRYMRSMGQQFGDWENMMKYLLASLSTKGAMGTIINLESHTRPAWNGPTAYTGNPRLILTTLRTSVERGEVLNLKARTLDQGTPGSVTLHWRRLGQGAFATKSFAKVNRGVYQVDFPAAEEDLEYYVEMRSSDGQTLLQPVTAPAINHTLVVPAIESTLKRNAP